MADKYAETLQQLKDLLTADSTGHTLQVQRSRRRRRYVAAKCGLHRSARVSLVIATLPTYSP